jgi:hypothetical protein
LLPELRVTGMELSRVLAPSGAVDLRRRMP